MTTTFQVAPDVVRQRGLARPNQVELSPAQLKMWGETKAAFMFNCPAFSHILYELMLLDGQLALFTRDISMDMPDGTKYYPPAATDGAHLIINPDEFFQFSLPQRIFITAHEVLHCVFDHMALCHALSVRNEVGYPDGVKLPWSPIVMNMAEDFVINDILVQSKIGEMPTKDGKPFGCHDTGIGTQDDNALVVYRRIFEKYGPKGAPGAKGFDVHLAPGSAAGASSPGQAAQARSQAAWKTGIAAAAAIGKMQGDKSIDFDRMFGITQDNKVNWREHIRALFARKVGNGGFDWRRADRRLISRSGDLGDPVFAPGRAGHGCDTIVVAGDTSGSINDPVLDVFFAEMAAMLEDLRPKRLVIIWCDAKVHRVDEAEDPGDLNVIRYKGAPGGGGTSFVPVFDEIAKLGLDTIDALVYLTDGYGTFPQHAPSYPVIWGDIIGTPNRYPFGDVVHVDLNA